MIETMHVGDQHSQKLKNNLAGVATKTKFKSLFEVGILVLASYDTRYSGDILLKPVIVVLGDFWFWEKVMICSMYNLCIKSFEK